MLLFSVLLIGMSQALLSVGRCSDPFDELREISIFKDFSLDKASGDWYPTMSDPDLLNGFDISCMSFTMEKTGPG